MGKRFDYDFSVKIRKDSVVIIHKPSGTDLCKRQNFYPFLHFEVTFCLFGLLYIIKGVCPRTGIGLYLCFGGENNYFIEV